MNTHTLSNVHWMMIITAFVILIIIYVYFSGTYAHIMSMFINPTTQKYRMTSPFGYRIHPVTGAKESFHNGEDYACPMDTPLLSPAAGTVTVSSHPTGGLQCVIKHTNGFTTGYAHLASVDVKSGDQLQQGQIFAHTGNSGASTGPHLHLTLRNPAGQRIAPSTHLYK